MRHKLTNRQLKWGIAAGVVLVGIAIGSWAMPANSTASEGLVDASKVQVLPVSVVAIGDAGPQCLPESFPGIVTARRSSTLGPKVLGRVTRISVDLGDFVAAGDTLCELDTGDALAEIAAINAELDAARAQLAELDAGPRDAEVAQGAANVEQLAANLELAKLNLERAQQLFARQAIPKQELDEASSAHNAAQAQFLESKKRLEVLHEGTRLEKLVAQRATVASIIAQLQRAQVNLDEHFIKAPYSCRIQKRLIDEGTVVNPGTPVLEVVETDHLEVHVGLPPTYTANDLKEDRVEMLLDGQVLSESLLRLAPSIDIGGRQLEAVFEISPSSAGRPVVGQVVEIQVQPKTNDQGVWVPTTSLTAASRGLWSILVATQSSIGIHDNANSSSARYVVERRIVEVIQTSGKWSRIRGPFKNSEWMVNEGVHRVVPGQVVSIDSSEAAANLPSQQIASQEPLVP